MKNERINQAATDAANWKRISKKGAFDIIIDLIESGAPLNERQAGELYGYFLPPVPKTAKTPRDWVAKTTAGKRRTRYSLEFVRVESGRMVAADGHRLHFTPSDLPDGYYDTNGALVKDIDANYPNVDGVIPEDNGDHITVKLADCKVTPCGGVLAVELVIGCWFNLKYVRDALAGRTEVKILNADTVGPNHSVLLDCKYGKAVIMPMRV